MKGVFLVFLGRAFLKIWQPANNMQWLKKERMKVWIFLSFSPYSSFGFNLRHMVMPTCIARCRINGQILWENN